jgi:hypothetical protein
MSLSYCEFRFRHFAFSARYLDTLPSAQGVPQAETSFFTYFLTPRNRVLLEKLTGSQLVKKFPAFYGTRMFITPFTCPYLEPYQSSLCPHSTSLRSILILSSHLRLGVPSSLFTSGFPTKTLYAPLLPPPYVLHAPQLSFFSI